MSKGIASAGQIPHAVARRCLGARSAMGLALISSLGLFLVAGCDSESSDGLEKVNGSVHVLAGKPPSAADTVNGNINIDDNAAVTGANTVNGGIHLGAHATADALNTVNGSVVIGAGAHVARNASSVNGGLTLRDGAEVLGSVSNVNGKLEVVAAHVGGGIKTVNGNITVYGASHVEDGILVQKTGGIIHFGNDVPRIEIGPGASVRGDLRFEREVKLYVSDKATIGTVIGATPIPFTGDTPPQD